jgi:hypothetical protein
MVLDAHYRSMLDCLDDRIRLHAGDVRAAAHLNFMLAGQAGAAALPRTGELEADLAEAGFAGIHAEPIVPTEPFLAVRAVLR